MASMTQEDKKELLEELKVEATSLGIDFNQRIGYDKLKAKVDEYYDKESKENTVAVKVKEEEIVADKPNKLDSRAQALQKIKDQQREGKKSKVVRITMVDKREASTATDAYFNDGSVAMRIPLDVWVEMPVYLINQAEESKALIHVESNGITSPKYTKKYVVEYK